MGSRCHESNGEQSAFPPRFQFKMCPFRDMLLSHLGLIHAAKVLHGDLRLDNVMVDDYGDVTIIDFDQAVLKSKKDELDKEYNTFAAFLEEQLDPAEREAEKVEHPPTINKQQPEIKEKTLKPVSNKVPDSSSRTTASGMVLRPRPPPRKR